MSDGSDARSDMSNRSRSNNRLDYNCVFLVKIIDNCNIFHDVCLR